MSVTDTIQNNITYGLVNTKDIKVDERGQRDVERRRAQFNRIMKNFDPMKANDLKVALIDGKYFCFDGQQTMKVLKAQNKGKDLEVPCRIYHGLTMLEVSNLFCAQNENKSPVQVSDMIRVKANYGDMYAIEFMRYTEKAGVDISWKRSRCKNSITAISTAYECFLKFTDREKYTEMLSAMKSAWNGLDEAFDARILKGMTEIYLAYPEVDSERMAKKLSFVRPTDIIRDAQIDRSCGARKYAVIILQHYNKSLSSDKRLGGKL